MADNLWRLTKTVPGSALPPDRKLAITKMTELFANSFAELDPEPIIAALATDATYVAQHILNDLEGREAIAENIRGRFARLREVLQVQPHLEMAEVDLPTSQVYPCVVGMSDGKPQQIYVLTLDQQDNIKRVSLYSVLPRPEDARRSGKTFGGKPIRLD